MKKISNKMLLSCLIAEIIALLCSIVLTEKSDYIWFAVVIFTIVIVFTFGECICRLNNLIKLWNENIQMKEQLREEEIKIFRDRIFEEIEQKTKIFSEKVDNLCSSQEKMMETNHTFCQNISESVSKIGENDNQLFTKLKDELSLGLSTIRDSFSDSSNNMEAHIIEFTKKTEENFMEIDKKNRKLITNIIESTSALQAETAEGNKEVVEKVCNIMDRIETDNKQTINDLSVRFTENSLAMSSQHSEDLASIVSELKNVVELLTKKYGQVLDDMSDRQMTQIEEWKAGTAEILSNSNIKIEALMNNVEEKLLQNSNLASRVLDENISSTRNAVSEIVKDTRDLLQKQYEKLEELNSSLSLDTKEYTKQLMEQILAVSGNNILEMESSCENVLRITVDRIISENEETGAKRTEAFEAYINELEKTYDSIISGHIKVLEEQISNSIALFISENKDALMTNNKLAADLISSEKSFVSEIENNNMKIRETINNAFAEYSKAVEQNIVDMKDVLTESIAIGSKNAIESIDIMSDMNIETVDGLTEKLRVYSDSLVEKSAIAIANVQSDNNEKLQNLCEQVSGYISENAKFITYCQDLSNALQSSISQLIDDRDRFIDDLNDISNHHLEGFDSHMKSRIQSMVEQLQSLNIRNAELFSGAMDEYREKFVEANASAIAEVQVDNVSSITDANDKISHLATNMKKFQEDICGTLSVLQSIIDTGVNEQKDLNENFDTDMKDLVDEKLSEYNNKLQQYNESIESLGKKITDVLNACQNNTSKYDETLRYIIEAQREANSLNAKDVQLLKSFMKR